MTHSTATSRRNLRDIERSAARDGGGRRRERDTPDIGYGTAGATALAPEPATEPARGSRPGLGRGTAPGRPVRDTGQVGPRLRVAPPAVVSGPRAPFVALVLAVVVAGVLGILVLNTKINENAFRLSDLRARQATLDRQEQELNQHIADQASPNSLAAAARRLGLVPSGTPAFIKLPDGRVLGVPQPATGTPSASGT